MKPKHLIEQRRRAGVLLHPTSLPESRGQGDLGPAAFHFVDFLEAAGLAVWQVLPLGPTHADRSPYQTTSVHAGNPELISLQRLHDWRWLKTLPEGEDADGPATRKAALEAAHAGFRQTADAAEQQAFKEFIETHSDWLEDFALYEAIKTAQDGAAWVDWPSELRDRRAAALEAFREEHSAAIEQVCFEQYVFFRQWRELRRYANDRDILLFGDIPIFVAHDSADVWAHPECFRLQRDGHPEVVAGVPPDYFSETGQRWGNPLYDWEHLRRTDYAWWWARLHTQRDLFDLIRIDHFRGFAASWEIPVDEETAINGRWVPGPGKEFFQRMLAEFGDLPLVAEDLGTITEDVEELRDAFHLPGMKILQFAFGGEADNPYLPHNHDPLSVVYSGTHDNNTTMGWFQESDSQVREHMLAYLDAGAEAMPWPLLRATIASVAHMAIVPMQDWLGLDAAHRMNMPGTQKDNWRWRFDWEMVPDELPERVRTMLALYGRV